MAMSKITKCEMASCDYNIDNTCHATAITIGDGERPACSTFCRFMTKNKREDLGAAGVGACRVSSCIYNSYMRCQAADISIGCTQNRPQCAMYRRNHMHSLNVYQVCESLSGGEYDERLPENFLG